MLFYERFRNFIKKIRLILLISDFNDKNALIYLKVILKK